MATANFVGTDYALEQSAIDRRRKLAEALLGQSQESPQGGMVGQVYVGASPLQHLAQLLKGQRAQEMMGQADQQSRDLVSNRNAELAKWLTGTPQGKQIPATDGVGPPQVTAPTRADMMQWALKGMNIAPELAGPMATKYMTPEAPIKLGKDETLLDPVTKQPIASNIKKETKEAGGQLWERQDDGKWTPVGGQPKPPEVKRVHLGKGQWQDFGFNPKTNDFDIPVGEPYENLPSAARVSATAAGPKIEVKTGESLGAQVGPMMADASSAAAGAVRQVDNAKRMLDALDSGKVIAGPTAKYRLFGAQLADVLGYGGKDTAERIAQTRTTVQSLAKFTLGARSQLKGQGQITDFETKLLERAESGNIDDMTPGELRIVAKNADRTARLLYQQYEGKLKAVKDNPNWAPIAPFYEVPAMPPLGQGVPDPVSPDIATAAQQELARRAGKK